MFALTFAVGMGVDYTLAARRNDKLNGIADAAALAAVTPYMMTQSRTAAQTAAQSVFDSQSPSVTSITGLSRTVTATDVAAGAKINRTVTVAYTANSQNAFSSLLGMNAIGIMGHQGGVEPGAEYRDFWLLLDTSPSMEIAATTAGINTMVANTSSYSGCAFGCHEINPSADGSAIRAAKTTTPWPATSASRSGSIWSIPRPRI